MRLGLIVHLMVYLALLPSHAPAQEAVPRQGTRDLILDVPTNSLLPRLELSGEDDEKVLQDAGIATDGPALLEFLRKRSLGASGPGRIQALIRQLGDRAFKVRDRASADLVLLGPAVLPFLRQAAQSTDPEVVRRAQECQRLIELRDFRVGIPYAALRVLSRKKPAGATKVLLDFLPYAENESVTSEVENALELLGLHNGRPDGALIAALSDHLPQRRAAAAEVVCRGGLLASRAESLPGSHEQDAALTLRLIWVMVQFRERQTLPALVTLTAVAPRLLTWRVEDALFELLHDDDPGVRLRVALALAASKQKQAIPVLIDLLPQLPRTQAWQAEDLLLRLAGETAPPANLGKSGDSQKKCRDAWLHWWEGHKDNLALSRLEQSDRPLGYTLLVMLNAGRIVELDAQDKERFAVDGLDFPLDAQMLSGDRVLVAEHNANRVTERNRRGEIVWEKKIESPLVAQRLHNGLTFIATPTHFIEVDRNGKEVATIFPPETESIMRARKLPNGEIICVLTSSRFVRLDCTGRVLQSFMVMVSTSGGRIEVLPNGHVLAPEMRHNWVAEYDAQGQIVRKIAFPSPVAATRLPNGHTLITSMEIERGVVEVDTAGKAVWEHRSETRITRAFRR
jgi:HEAT repeat protein